jgi:Holliday junction resolvase RusA-like endonuclease
MLILDLDNVILPRVNERYNKNFSLTADYRDKKQNLINEISLYSRGMNKIKSPYSVIVQVGTHLDIDSFIKPLFDAMQSSCVIDNDKNILTLTVEKTKLKRNESNWIKVELMEY